NQASTEIYAVSLHDALPISTAASKVALGKGRDMASASPSSTHGSPAQRARPIDSISLLRSMPTTRPAEPTALAISSVRRQGPAPDRKSTRLNSSHDQNSYAV